MAKQTWQEYIAGRENLRMKLIKAGAFAAASSSAASRGQSASSVKLHTNHYYSDLRHSSRPRTFTDMINSRNEAHQDKS